MPTGLAMVEGCGTLAIEDHEVRKGSAFLALTCAFSACFEAQSFAAANFPIHAESGVA